MQDIKLAFMQKTLLNYFPDVIKAMGQAIEQKNAIDTNKLRESLRYTVQQLGNSSVQGSLSFDEVGRFLDMGVNKNNPLGGVKEIGNTLKARSGMKPRKIYASIAYGKLNGLMGELLFGLSDETIQTLKQELADVST